MPFCWFNLVVQYRVSDTQTILVIYGSRSRVFPLRCRTYRGMGVVVILQRTILQNKKKCTYKTSCTETGHMWEEWDRKRNKTTPYKVMTTWKYIGFTHKNMFTRIFFFSFWEQVSFARTVFFSNLREQTTLY